MPRDDQVMHQFISIPLQIMGWLLLLVVAILLLASRFLWPIKAFDGEWYLTRYHAVHWKDRWPGYGGAVVRDYIWDVDWFVRREWDWEGDGIYDCREDDCPYKRTYKWARCVSYRRKGKWIPAPPQVMECAPDAH